MYSVWCLCSLSPFEGKQCSGRTNAHFLCLIDHIAYLITERWLRHFANSKVLNWGLIMILVRWPVGCQLYARTLNYIGFFFIIIPNIVINQICSKCERKIRMTNKLITKLKRQVFKFILTISYVIIVVNSRSQNWGELLFHLQAYSISAFDLW